MAKKKVEKKPVVKKATATKKEIIKVKATKPKKIEAKPSHVEVPYVPRKIDRLPPDLNKK